MRVCVVIGLLISLVALNSGVNAEDIRAKKRKRKSKAGAPSSGAFSDVTVDSAGGLSSGQPAQGSATATSRRAASANNVDPSSDIAAASKLTDKAMELVRSGRHAAALSPFQQACLLEPDNAGRWANLGSVLRDLGRSKDALAAYERGLVMSPDDPLLKEQHLALLELLGKTSTHESSAANPSLSNDGSVANSAPVSGSGSQTTSQLKTAPPATATAAQGASTQEAAASPASHITAAVSSSDSDIITTSRTATTSTTTTTSAVASSKKGKLRPPLKLPVKPAQAPPAGTSSLVHCATSKGDLDIVVHGGWAPHGTARFLELVESGFFSSGQRGLPLYRAVSGFMVQFGASTDPNITSAWHSKGPIPDDKQWLPKGAKRFRRGMISFAGSGPNTRSTQLFVSYAGIGLGDAPHEVPFGTLVGEHSFQTLDAFYTGYGEIGAFGGQAPDPIRISAFSGEEESSGEDYLFANFPELDYIQSCALTWQSNWTTSDHKPSPSSPSSTAFNSNGDSVTPITLVTTTPATTSTANAASPAVAPPPPLPLPRYHPSLPWPPPMSHAREASFFWWLDPLKREILRLQDEEEIAELKEASNKDNKGNQEPEEGASEKEENGHREILRPGEVHSVDKFINLQERNALRSMILRLKRQQGQGKVVNDKTNEPDMVHRTSTNGASNVAAFPPVWVTEAATEEDRNLVVQTLAKVAVYANRRVLMEGTLQGDHKQDDAIGAHLGIFAMYDYQPDPLGKASEVVPHTDSDYQGRCLSAALHLDNWDLDEEEETDKGESANTSPATVPTGGGAFQTFSCKPGNWLNQVSKGKGIGKRGKPKMMKENCEGAAGAKLEALIEAGIFHHRNDTLQVEAEIPYQPGRLAMFLPETPHAVTPLTGPGSRAVLFMWFHCRQFTQPPGRYPGVQDAIERADLKFKAQREAERNTRRPREGEQHWNMN